MAKLYFYYSSMNAGKSTTLLQSDFNYRERGMETMLWTAAVDDRYGRGRIVSRIGLEAQAHLFEADTDMFAAIAARMAARPGPDEWRALQARLRAAAEEVLANCALTAHDYVLIGRQGTPTRDFGALKNDLETGLRKLGAFRLAAEENGTS